MPWLRLQESGGMGMQSLRCKQMEEEARSKGSQDQAEHTIFMVKKDHSRAGGRSQACSGPDRY